jgi:hypothetical protein
LPNVAVSVAEIGYKTDSTAYMHTPQALAESRGANALGEMLPGKGKRNWYLDPQCCQDELLAGRGKSVGSPYRACYSLAAEAQPCRVCALNNNVNHRLVNPVKRASIMTTLPGNEYIQPPRGSIVPMVGISSSAAIENIGMSSANAAFSFLPLIKGDVL